MGLLTTLLSKSKVPGAGQTSYVGGLNASGILLKCHAPSLCKLDRTGFLYHGE